MRGTNGRVSMRPRATPDDDRRTLFGAEQFVQRLRRTWLIVLQTWQKRWARPGFGARWEAELVPPDAAGGAVEVAGVPGGRPIRFDGEFGSDC